MKPIDITLCRKREFHELKNSVLGEIQTRRDLPRNIRPVSVNLVLQSRRIFVNNTNLICVVQ